MIQVHDLKIWPIFFEAIVNRTKTFEYRLNDRNFKVGDHVNLREWSPSSKEYTGRAKHFIIGYLIMVSDTHCCFSLLEDVTKL